MESNNNYVHLLMSLMWVFLMMSYSIMGVYRYNDMRVNHDIFEAPKIVDTLFILPHNDIGYIDIPLLDIISQYKVIIN